MLLPTEKLAASVTTTIQDTPFPYQAEVEVA